MTALVDGVEVAARVHEQAQGRDRLALDIGGVVEAAGIDDVGGQARRQHCRRNAFVGREIRQCAVRQQEPDGRQVERLGRA